MGKTIVLQAFQQKKTCFILCLFVLFVNVYSQNTKDKLTKSKKAIEEAIQYTNDLLADTKKNKAFSLEELIILTDKIKKREQLIALLTDEIKTLDHAVNTNEKEIKKLAVNLQDLKNEYAKLIYYAYKNKNSVDRLMLIFSADDFNQAYQRFKYLQYYGAYRKTQAALIVQTQDSIRLKNKQLQLQKAEKQNLLADQKQETVRLDEEKKVKNTTLAKLAKKEKQLLADIRVKQKEVNSLNKAIEKILQKEVEAAAAKKRSTQKKSDIVSHEADRTLSDNFSANKGKLPWPSRQGIISSSFGEIPHPVLKKIKIQNNGIDILTRQGEKARAVFDGTVISVRTITNTNKAVIIKHGEYFSVYSNLHEVFVTTGDKVSTGQEIGLIETNTSQSKTELHFEIWKGKDVLNPVQWISKG